MLRTRRAARILIREPAGGILLLRFAYSSGPLAGTGYWGVPGGGVEEGESLAAAAKRELREETGIEVDDPGPVAATGNYEFRLSSGELVLAEDHYFLLELARRREPERGGLTNEERDSLVEHRWWTAEEIRNSRENLIPPDLPEIIVRAGVTRARAPEME